MAKQVISFHYELKDDAGNIVDSSRAAEPLSFLEGSGSIIPKLEDALLPLKKGDQRKIVISFQDGYGPYDETMVAKVPRKQFPTDNIKEGDMFEIQKEQGVRLVVVIEVTGDIVTIDANHPLAGKNLNFDIEIMDRREATPEEIAHGHAHNPGHDHHH